MLKALFPGTFDPPTLGHLELIARALTFCDHLIIGIGKNTAKGKPILSIKEREESLKMALKQHKNLEITSFSGLVTDFAKKNGIKLLIRGLRSAADYDYEIQMAMANRKLTGIETIFLMAEGGAGYISSTLIRELALHGAPLKDFIPKNLETTLKMQMQKET